MSRLSQSQRRTVAAFAETFFGTARPAISVEEVVDNIDAHLGAMRSKRSRSLSLVLFVIEHVLPRRHGLFSRFSKLSPGDRRTLIDDLLRRPSKRYLLRALLKDLARIRTLFTAGYYGDPRVYPSIGFEAPAARARYRPPGPPLQRLPGAAVPRLTVPVTDAIECEVCVVGSGAGGAIVAALLAEKGKQVVLLEEGDYAGQPTHDERTMLTSLYKEGGLQTTVDFDMVILQGRTLGGSAAVNNAICFRLDDADLTPPVHDVLGGWRRESGAVVDAAELGRSFDRVEARLGIARLDPSLAGGNGDVLLQGHAALARADPVAARMKAGLFKKNYDTCLGCGYCIYGCPYVRKRSVLEAYITPASQLQNLRVFPTCHVDRVVRRSKRAVGVACTYAGTRQLGIAASEAVVVSAGAIGSSVLLMKSGIRGQVGRSFSFNAATPVFARFPPGAALRGWDGVQMATYVDGRDFILESIFYPPMALASSLPGWFEEHFERMQAYNRLACAAVVIGTRNNARVKRSSWARDTVGPVKYTMHDSDLANMRAGIVMLSQIFFAAGAEAVIPATFDPVEMSAADFANRPQRIRDRIDATVRQPSDLTLSTAHPQGGNVMAADAARGVVDSGLRVHGTENLYVCDASVFPTTVRVNPQWSIMAMADYFVRTGF